MKDQSLGGGRDKRTAEVRLLIAERQQQNRRSERKSVPARKGKLTGKHGPTHASLIGGSRGDA